jgi:hypothetical protein
MSGLLALLDDVAAMAKLAGSQVDDIAAHAVKAGGKSAGIVIDDAAVTPKSPGLVTGFSEAIALGERPSANSSRCVGQLPSAVIDHAFAANNFAVLRS